MARWYITLTHNGVTRSTPVVLNDEGQACMGNFGHSSIYDAQDIPDKALFILKQDITEANRIADYGKYKLHKLK